MFQESNGTRYFTQETVEIAARLWARSSISLIDVRNQLFHPDKPLQKYRLPTSMFIYTQGGAARVTLNHVSYQSGRFGIFHGGKGAELSIYPIDTGLETYMVLYKAESTPFYRRDIQRLLEQVNPFVHLFGFSPENPLYYMEKFQCMHARWNEKSAVHQFYAKSILYQIAHRVYEEFDKGLLRFVEPDFVDSVKRYLDQHYMEPVSIQSIIEMLPVSRSQLVRLFKQRERKNFQEYLNERRLEAAKRYLENTNATIQEIAMGCGFGDELNMQRMFKKKVLMTPSEYRLKMMPNLDVYDVDNDYHRHYNGKWPEHLAKIQRGGELTMFGQTRSKQMILTAAMSLLLLLSACTSSTSVNNEGRANQTQQVHESTTGAENPAQTQKRVVKTVKGDVEVPASIKRVAVHTWAGDLLALGIIPAISNDANLGAAKDALSGTQMSMFEDPEEIMAVDPDLIITRTEEQYEKLKNIASTILVPYDTSLEDRMRLFGQVFHVEEAAQKALDSFYAKADKYVQDLKSMGIYGKTMAIVFYNDDGPFIYGDDWGFGGQILYGLLGFKLPAIIKKEIVDTGKGFRQFSWEAAPDYLKADYLEIGNGDDSLLLKASKNAIWNNVDAVKNKHIITYSKEYDRKSLYVMDKVLDFYHEQFMNLVQ
ncbi:helix-turn-helix domain-containing protein [Paenibacillus sp. GCM10012303]|uniref:helix-turn-helix domain-containing protein n=1 Tax=Paenibacillus sp. GCM10012303 TaxID=3317340 RepID=UPI00360E7869